MFVTWIVVGLLTGWLLSVVLKHGGYGRMSDAILGTVAAAFGAPSEAGRGAMAAAAFGGAALMTVLQRKILPSRTLRNVRTTDG